LRRIVRYRQENSKLLWVTAAATIVGLVILAIKLWYDKRRLERRLENNEEWR